MRDLLLLLALTVPVSAQWFDYPTKGIPRTPDGKANLSAPAPKTADGKPDLSGVWLGDQWSPPGRRTNPPGAGRGGGAPEMLPWAKKVFDERRASSLRDDPEARCMPQGVPKAATLPYPFEIVNAGNKTLILFEMYSLRRQIFTDGRELPKDPNPTWFGYSVGKWEGDDWVVNTIGIKESTWMDNAGRPHSDALHLIERFQRHDFGHMDILLTIDDPKAYTKPWTVTIKERLIVDTELIEEICLEGEKDLQHLK
jgi:hypothetical protein